MTQVPSDRFDSLVFAAAQEVDVLLNVERSVSGANIIRLTAYEWNESKFCALQFGEECFEWLKNRIFLFQGTCSIC